MANKNTEETVSVELPGLTTVTILGFNRVGKSWKVNTSPHIDVWLNTAADYDLYRGLVGQQASFASRNVTSKRTGEAKKVYDLNVSELSQEDIDALGSQWEDTTADTASDEKPF